MRRTNKKDLNLSKLKTGCAPCLNEAQKMQQKLSDREVSKIKIEEIKKMYHLYLKKIKFDVKHSDLNACILSSQIK
jgi:hypothetical protein